jgi:DNA-binding response OmpR family regulator
MEPGLPTGPNVGLETHGVAVRVLVIEGSGYTAGLLEEIAALTGLSVELTRDPRDGLRRLRGDWYDAVVVDLPAPHMTAEDLFRRIVAIDLDQARRVVFIANDLGEPATLKFLTDAGRPFLTQPVDPLELYDLILRVGLSEAEA